MVDHHLCVERLDDQNDETQDKKANRQTRMHLLINLPLGSVIFAGYLLGLCAADLTDGAIEQLVQVHAIRQLLYADVFTFAELFETQDACSRLAALLQQLLYVTLVRRHISHILNLSCAQSGSNIPRGSFT